MGDADFLGLATLDAPRSAGIRASGRLTAITVCVACWVGRVIDSGIGAGFAVLSGSVRGCEIRWSCARPGVLATGSGWSRRMLASALSSRLP
jgi:hypothetical protein